MYHVSMTLEQGSILPSYGSNGAAGLDLYARHGYVLRRKGIYMIGTGISMAMPDDLCALILPRSSLHKRRMRLANTVGLVDSDFRGEIMLAIEYDGYLGKGEPDTITPGDRLAQLLFIPVSATSLYTVNTLAPSMRGTGGFGSTGK